MNPEIYIGISALLGGLIAGNIASYYITKKALEPYLTSSYNQEIRLKYINKEQKLYSGFWRIFTIGAKLAIKRQRR